MKIFIFLLIMTALLQSSFIPTNLVLILLICRSLAMPEKENLYLAFLGGILVGLLQTQNIGFWALVFLLMVKVIHLTKKLPFSRNIFTVFGISALMIILVSILESFYFQTAIDQTKILVEILLILPIYLMILFWEERFVVKHDSRLKLRS